MEIKVRKIQKGCIEVVVKVRETSIDLGFLDEEETAALYQTLIDAAHDLERQINIGCAVRLGSPYCDRQFHFCPIDCPDKDKVPVE